MGENNNKKTKLSTNDCDSNMKTIGPIRPVKYDCPEPSCDRKYKREITLFTHILLDHRVIFDKLIAIVNDKDRVKQICNSPCKKPETNGEVQPNGNIETLRQSDSNTTSIPSTSKNIPKTNVVTRPKASNGITQTHNEEQLVMAIVRRSNNTSNTPSTSVNSGFRVNEMNGPTTSASTSIISEMNTPTTSTSASTLSDTTNNILKQIKQSPYYHLQVNETIDVNSYSYLIVTVRYKHKNVIQEDVLFTKKIVGTITAADILNYILDLITKGELCPKKWIGISMDGVRAASSPLNDIMELITQKGLDVKLTFHFTRRAEFISQHLSADLHTVLNEAIQFINEQKTSSSNTFCAGMDNVTKEIFLHTDRYWLSYGNVLTQLFGMRKLFNGQMCDPDWQCSLAYLADIFEHFNRFYQQLIANNSSIFQIYSEFENMIDTLKMDKDQFSWQAATTSYRNLQIFLSEPSVQINPIVLLGIQKSLKDLSNHLYKYLPVSGSEVQACEWIINPFKFNAYNLPVDLAGNAVDKTELMELRKNLQKKFAYNYKMLELFWIDVFEMYPNISNRAMQHLLTFKSGQLNESEFAKLVVSENLAVL